MSQNRITGYGVGSPKIDLAPPPLPVARAPTTLDTDFEIGQLWLDTVTDVVYTYFGRGVWVAGGGSAINFVTGSGTAVPSGGILNVSGSGGVSTSGSGNTVTIIVNDLGVSWFTVSTPTLLVAGNGYIASGGVTVAFTTPAIADVGDTFIVTGNATQWTVTPSAGQSIQLGPASAATGLASTLGSDTVHIICIVANTTFKVLLSFGNISFS